MERQAELPFLDDLVDGRLLSRLDPRFRDALLARSLDDLGVIGVGDDVEHLMVDFPLVARRGSRYDLVHVVEQHAHVAQAADARVGADRRQAVLEAREAEDALLGLICLPVEEDFLVGAGRHAVAPATAAILRDEYDAVLLTLVDGTRRAGCDAGRIQAVVADARQVLHEQVMEFERDIRSHLLEVDVLASRLAVGEVVLPVRAPLDLHAFTRDERARAGNRLVVAALGVDERLVVVRPRLVVVVHLRLVRMVEELQQALRLRARAQ